MKAQLRELLDQVKYDKNGRVVYNANSIIPEEIGDNSSYSRSVKENLEQNKSEDLIRHES